MTNQPDVTIRTGDEKNLETHLKEQELRLACKKARDFFSGLQEELEEKEDDLTGGLSLLDLKNDLLLSYMIDICNIVLRQIRNEQIEGHQSVDRCVEYRVILEKIKGIDQKLAYQLNKLITRPDDEEEQKFDVQNLDVELSGDEAGTDIANNQEAAKSLSSESEDIDESGESDIESVSAQSDSDESESKETNVKKSKSKPKLQTQPNSSIYKPPKLRSVAYKERRNRDEFYQDEDPNTIVDETRARVDEGRVRFEEDNYTRLPDAKRKSKAKNHRRKSFKKSRRR